MSLCSQDIFSSYFLSPFPPPCNEEASLRCVHRWPLCSKTSHFQKSVSAGVDFAPQRVVKERLRGDPVCVILCTRMWTFACHRWRMCVCARAMLDSRPTQQLLITLTEKSLSVSSINTLSFSLSGFPSVVARFFSFLIQIFCHSYSPLFSLLLSFCRYYTTPKAFLSHTSLHPFLLFFSLACHAEAVVNARLDRNPPFFFFHLRPFLLSHFLSICCPFLCHHILPLLSPSLTPFLTFPHSFLCKDQLSWTSTFILLPSVGIKNTCRENFKAQEGECTR